MTGSMQRAVQETQRRRALQETYNREHDITPETIQRAIDDLLITPIAADYSTVSLESDAQEEELLADSEALEAEVSRLEREMLAAAERLDFEVAAERRDRIRYLRRKAVLE
jgi:excinuclease ABC subunit B